MSKVLYITTVSRTINAFLVPHIEMLLDNGYDVDCACCIDKPIDNKLLQRGVGIYNVPFSRNPLAKGNLKALSQLEKLQSMNKYNIIHVHTPIASFYGRILKRKFPEVKIIYTAHGYHFLKGGSKLGWMIYYPIEKMMAKLTDVIININSEDFEITRKKLKPKKCYLINGVGIDLSKYKIISSNEIESKRKELAIDKDDFVIIMIAELNKNKNQMQLIKSMELLNNKYKNIKVICVGEGKELSKLQKEIKSKGLEKNILFLGFRTDINELINISDIGVLLSFREGLPKNIMELMACGKKVIATNIRGCRDLVENKGIGQLVNINDYKDTALKIEKYYLNRDSIFHVPKEIYKYDINNINEELKEIYNSLNKEENVNESKSEHSSTSI